MQTSLLAEWIGVGVYSRKPRFYPNVRKIRGMTIDSQTLRVIETSLLAERKRLESELGQFAKKNPNNPEDYNAEFPQIGTSEEDNASEVAIYSDNLTLERTLESSLRDVNKALQRIKEGSYGTCRHCGKNIDPKRLVARPTSSSCIECKKALTGGA